ncbi:MAG TPA: hypothetical protein VGY91_05545 [Chthoniobacterales bacterium]|jgi:hypothetical protein|nr:hypothetical protein [Chthoniobacterales bacterium]
MKLRRFRFDRTWLGLDSRPEHIKEVAEASLKGLKVDAIDLFFFVTGSKTPYELRGRSPLALGAEMDMIHIDLAVDQCLASV